MLDRLGAEVDRATSIVRVEPSHSILPKLSRLVADLDAAVVQSNPDIATRKWKLDINRHHRADVLR